MSVYQMGPETLAVPMTLFRNNRNRVIKELQKSKAVDEKTYVLLQGGNDVSFNDTDVDYLFRQESYFQYMFGVKEPGCYGAIHVKSGRSILFVPRLPEEYSVWLGHLHTLDDFKKMYEVDEVRYCDHLEKFFDAVNTSVILTLSGKNSDSGLDAKPADFKGLDKFVCNCDILYPIITEWQVIS